MLAPSGESFSFTSSYASLKFSSMYLLMAFSVTQDGVNASAEDVIWDGPMLF